MQHGDHVLIRAIVKGETNEKEPSGHWWVEIEGCLGLTAVPEAALIADVPVEAWCEQYGAAKTHEENWTVNFGTPCPDKTRFRPW
jgi:hypothetical protein